MIKRSVHAKSAVDRPGQGSKYRRARRIRVGGRPNECAHGSSRERKQVGDHIACQDPRDLGHPLRLEQIGVIVVRGVVDRSGLGAGSCGVDHLPKHALVERQIGQLKPEALGRLHHRLLGRKRQPFKIINRADAQRIDTGLQPALAIVGVTAGTERDHFLEPCVLKSFDHGTGLPQPA